MKLRALLCASGLKMVTVYHSELGSENLSFVFF